MVNFFIGEIEVGRITVEDVPKLWREKVREKLAAKAAEQEAAE